MKKYIKIGIILLVSILIIYFGIYQVQNILAKKTFEDYNKEKLGEKTKSYLIRCNWNIFEPEFAYTFYWNNQGEVSFENPNIFLLFNKNVWENSYVGGTTVQNTTFEELLKMVKDDCYQFQEHGSIGTGENVPIWTYTKVESKEEIERRKQERLKRKQEKEEKLQEMLNNMTEEERKAYEKEQERLKNRTEEEILRDKGYSEEEIQERLKIEWKDI